MHFIHLVIVYLKNFVFIMRSPKFRLDKDYNFRNITMDGMQDKIKLCLNCQRTNAMSSRYLSKFGVMFVCDYNCVHKHLYG